MAPSARSSAGEPVGIRDQMGILRPIGLTVGPRAVLRIVSAVAGQPPGGGKGEQTEPQPTRLSQRPALPAVGGGDHRPLEDVGNAPKVCLPSRARPKVVSEYSCFSRPGRNSTIR